MVYTTMTRGQTMLETVEDEYAGELKVTFYPQLYLQRRIWILDVMRAEKVTRVEGFDIIKLSAINRFHRYWISGVEKDSC